MRRSIVLVASLLLAAVSAQAQITLYEDDDFAGARIDLYEPVFDFGNTGFNDRASSIIVHDGSWQVCENAGYAGRCVTLARGSYPSLRPMGLNDAISSVRPVGAAGGRPPPGIGGPAGGRIALYEGSDFTGRAMTFDRDNLNLDSVGLNDRAQSAIVYDGNWQLCEHEEFRGQCEVLGPGRYANLGNLSRRVSSLRIAGYPAQPIAPGPGPAYPPSWGGQVRVILYEGQNFSGRQYVIERNRMPNLDGTGFNDRASSLRVERGYWMFCSDANFEGECRTFGPGDYPTLPPGLNNRLSSGRRISEHFPYNQNPNWTGSGYTQQ